GVGIFLRGAHGEFLNYFRGEILQEASDPVIRIVGAVDREFVVQARTSTGGDRGDARLRWVGGFDRFRAGHEVSDVGEAARGERESLEVLTGNYALVNGAGQINGLGGDRRSLRLNVHFLGQGCGL